MEAHEENQIAGLQILKALQEECKLSDADISFIKYQTSFLHLGNYMCASTSLHETIDNFAKKSTSEIGSFFSVIASEFPFEKRVLFWKLFFMFN